MRDMQSEPTEDTTMTVQELIAYLSKLPQDREVCIDDEEGMAPLNVVVPDQAVEGGKHIVLFGYHYHPGQEPYASADDESEPTPDLKAPDMSESFAELDRKAMLRNLDNLASMIADTKAALKGGDAMEFYSALDMLVVEAGNLDQDQ